MVLKLVCLVSRVWLVLMVLIICSGCLVVMVLWKCWLGVRDVWFIMDFLDGGGSGGEFCWLGF